MSDCKDTSQVFGRLANTMPDNSSLPSDRSPTRYSTTVPISRNLGLATIKERASRSHRSYSVSSENSSPMGAFARPELKKRATVERSSGMGLKPKVGSLKESEVHDIVMLGVGGVGKTALVVRFVTGRFLNEYDPNLEMTYEKEIQIGENDVSLQILDTAGNADASYIKRGEGFIIVYSITDHYSFEAARQLVKLIKEVRKSEGEFQVPILLVGNKRDLRRGRSVAKEEARETASEFSCSHYETSAASNTNVQMIFYNLVFQIRFMKQSRQRSLSAQAHNGFLSSMKRHLFRRGSLPA